MKKYFLKLYAFIKRIRFTYTQIVALGFLAVILAGSLLLSLPAASNGDRAVSYFDALFTSTSATCVTGLVPFDTKQTWSLFGQVIILVLIETGGLGFMSIITMFSIFLRRRISLHERRLLMQSAGTMRISGVVKLIKRIMTGTLAFQGLGTLALSIRFIPRFGLVKGLYYALFHAVSAFCNAGFDLLGNSASLTMFGDDVLVNVTVMILIIVGGLGFIVWNDIALHKLNFKRYDLHSKIVLSVSAVLILLGWGLFFVFEKNDALSGLSLKDRILAAAFCSVTSRTAGFTTINLRHLSEAGRVLMIVLMFIGGSPGSTAGGIKTTTLAVLIIGVISASRHSSHITMFKKRLEPSALSQASAIFSIYIFAVLAAVLAICAIESFSAEEIIFEVVSAVGTVGLTLGITPHIGVVSKIILMILMFGGRVGALTFMLSLAEKKVNVPLDRPIEKILIG